MTDRLPDDKHGEQRSKLVQHLADQLRNGWVGIAVGEAAATELERLEDAVNMLGRAALSHEVTPAHLRPENTRAEAGPVGEQLVYSLNEKQSEHFLKTMQEHREPTPTMIAGRQRLEELSARSSTRPRAFDVATEGADGWSEWFSPAHADDYGMKCCDCGLVHQAQFRVIRNEVKKGDGTYEADVVPETEGYRVQFRMKREDELGQHLHGEHHAIQAQNIASPSNACSLKETCLWLKRLALAPLPVSATRRSILEEAARICDARAEKHGKDDEAENEAQLCAALIRAASDGTGAK